MVRGWFFSFYVAGTWRPKEFVTNSCSVVLLKTLLKPGRQNCVWRQVVKWHWIFWNVMPEKNSEQLDRSREIWRSIRPSLSQGGKKASYTQQNECRVAGLDTPCVGTAFQNTLLKGRQKEREDEDEDISSYCMTLRKGKGTETWERGSTRSQCPQNSFWEGAWTCSKTENTNEWDHKQLHKLCTVLQMSAITNIAVVIHLIGFSVTCALCQYQ